ncbi:MAG: hsp70 family protein [Desulfobacterales bacterium]|nr:hsp70 family protein [Desulfobacterales bacterium]
MNHNKRFIIGIDLGTTNCAVSYVDLNLEPKKQNIKLFKVPQLTGHGEVTRQPILPSFLYIPGQYDISKEAIVLPWKTNENNFVGIFARDHGIKVPARLVSSAKSWLCHPNVDRKAKILPWGANPEVSKISPVLASAAYLKHIKDAWNFARGDNEDQYLENQIIIITVPASFDEIARDLTMEAANISGLNNVTLLEEPLAAFYSWLISHEDEWSDFVKPNELILVCDVGGGTTDFTLITLRDVDGNPRFERIAVGDHLILGGDNIDLALARQIESRFTNKKLSLTVDRWKSLCHQCRQAKEMILGNEVDSKKITLMGEGGKLIAGTISATLDSKTVEQIVLEGFFPLVSEESSKKKTAQKGITEFGLPFEHEPAITKHMGRFLENHKDDVYKILKRENCCPDLILFNGGSLKPRIIQERMREAIRHWFKEQDNSLPKILDNPDPDLAVALGASYYGLVKIGHGVRVGSGSARAYYLGVSKGTEVNEKVALCLVERGLEEGSDIELKDKKFEVLANQPVSFDAYSSSFRANDKTGDLINIDDSLTPLPPIQTVVYYGKKGMKTTIPVQIGATYTEVGTLSLWCKSLMTNHKWQFQFQLRDNLTPTNVSNEAIFEESIIEDACRKIQLVFSDPKIDSLDNLVKEITTTIGSNRDKWPLGLIRIMADTLLTLIENRSKSPESESRWLNLTGFCMRPGFGEAFDEKRIKEIWKIYREGALHSNNAQNRSEWWIMWRRIAGGLPHGQQRQFIQDVTNILYPKKDVKCRVSDQERIEIWMAISNMERLSVKDKVKWGKLLLSEIQPKKCKPQTLWSISRIGARELLYGPIDRVIPQEVASEWIQILLSQTWHNPKQLIGTIVHMARKTGDRTRDIDSTVISKIIDWMLKYDLSQDYKKYLTDVIPLAKQEESAIFGESLPAGIIFHEENVDKDEDL